MGKFFIRTYPIYIIVYREDTISFCMNHRIKFLNICTIVTIEKNKLKENVKENNLIKRKS